jgi:hypothetical protein
VGVEEGGVDAIENEHEVHDLPKKGPVIHVEIANI